VTPVETENQPTDILGRLASQARSMHVDQFLLEPGAEGNDVRVMMQEEGRARPASASFGEELPGIVRVVKNLARLESNEKERAQEGVIIVPVREEEDGVPTMTRLYVTTTPGPVGELVWLRVAEPNEQRPTPTQVGIPGFLNERLTSHLGGAKGMFLIVGPAGSRKRQVLRTVAAQLTGQGRRAFSAEEPVLWDIQGLKQEGVDPTLSRSSSQLLEKFLQQQTSLILLERLADRDTAQQVCSPNGRKTLILSTVNATTATSVIPRLVGLGIGPKMLASSLTGVLGQRLVRRNCPYCLQTYEPSRATLGEWFRGDVPRAEWKHGTGCANCRGTGFSGRILVTELWIPNEEERAAVADGSEGQVLRQLVQRRIRCIGQAVLEEAIAGQTTLEDGLKSVPYEDVVHTRIHGLEREKEAGTESRLEGAA
jgi:type II secretory ATPase GspE/PulE/Tfp pilus assembly ATPase PilB-like protein